MSVCVCVCVCIFVRLIMLLNSFQINLLSFSFIMMDEHQNGMNLNGLSEPFMLVLVSRPSGKEWLPSLFYAGFVRELSSYSGWCILCFKFSLLKFCQGGMPNDFCILTLLHHLTTFLFGMKTLDWIISMRKSEFGTLRIDYILMRKSALANTKWLNSDI